MNKSRLIVMGFIVLLLLVTGISLYTNLTREGVAPPPPGSPSAPR